MTQSVVRSTLALVELADADGLADVHGQQLFGELLDAYLDRLKSWVRNTDTWRVLVNNRFCVVLDGLNSPAELELATAKLARVFEKPHQSSGKAVPLGVTVGFATMVGANVDNDIAIRQASLALRQAKASNRLYEVYSPRIEQTCDHQVQLLRELQEAVQLGELELYFQPKIHARQRSLIGAEALMRWHTKERQVLQPDEFMDVAERNPVIRAMTWWAIKSSVCRLSRWPEKLSIAVNITPTLLLDDEILSVVRDSLDIYGVQAHRLNLEVTENVMVDNQQIMLAQLARLREIGVRVSIDDFGTGFSSLAYFRDLPADEIKIDKCFVMPMLSSRKDHAIVKAVIDLAHNFSLRVVAEGVEDEAIAQRLTELGCVILQGYAIDKPLKIEEFERRYINVN